MKKITDIDNRIIPMNPEDEKKDELPTVRTVFRSIGNAKAETADAARRVRRIISRLSVKSEPAELILENDDMAFLLKVFEQNPMGWSGWIQGQALDLIDAAEKVDPVKKD
jgi:hypothetical protein